VGSLFWIEGAATRVLSRIRTVHQATGSAPANANLRVQLTPLGEVDSAGRFQRGVRFYPAVGAKVESADARDIQDFLTPSEEGVNIGDLSQLAGVPVSLDIRRTFSRHLAILGQSGSGKSWAVATLIQRSVQQFPRAHIVLLDIHGEYSWHGPDGQPASAFPGDVAQSLDATELEIPYWLLTFAELVDLFIDRNDANASTQIAFLRETVQDLKTRSNPEMGPVSIDSPVYFPMAELYLQFKEANSKTFDFGKKKGPLFGQFDEFLIRLQSRLNDRRYAFLLKPKKRNSSATLPPLMRELVGLGDENRAVTVIDLSGVPFDVRPTVTAQIGRLVFEFNYWNPYHRQFPLLLVCEEAHSYIPRAGQTRYEGTRRAMERIAKEGRKYGVGLAVVSQRPHELSETVLSQCGSFLCFRLTNPDDQTYVQQLVPEGERNLVETLSALGRGEALVLGEAVPIPLRLQCYAPHPTPNSADVDYGAGWRSGPRDIPVEDIAGRWRSQSRKTVGT